MAKKTFVVAIFYCLVFYEVILLADSDVNCPSSWAPCEESGTCLNMIMIEKTWDDARAYCQDLGGDLVSDITEKKNDFIFETYSCYALYFWIGLNDLNDDYIWTWLDENTETSFTDWSNGFEWHEGWEVGDGYYCAYGYYHSVDDSGWSSTPCDDQLVFLCEIPSITGSETASVTPVTCPPDWIVSEESGSCIYISTAPHTLDEISWEDARAACQSMEDGADLVKILNFEMNNFIAYASECMDNSPRVSYWTGLNYNQDRDVWAWLDEDSETEYTVWRSDAGQPMDGDCVILEDDGVNEWVNTNCGDNYDYVCEFIPATTTQVPLTRPADVRDSSVAANLDTNQPTDEEESFAYSGLSVGAAVSIALACLLLVGVAAALLYRQVIRPRPQQIDTVKFVSVEHAEGLNVTNE